ncbi:hypothetical protein ACFL1S_05460 [Pseudomonadota bacterium]
MVTDHISFARGYEHIDLLVLKRAFDAIDHTAIEKFVRATPTGAMARRVCPGATASGTTCWVMAAMGR